MTTPSREELTLQFQNARLQVDKDLLAVKASEAEFREQVKDLIASNQKTVDTIRLEVLSAMAKNGEAFQTLRSDVNVRISGANENTEKLRADLYKGFSEQHRWFIGVLVAIAIAVASQWFKTRESSTQVQTPVTINAPSTQTSSSTQGQTQIQGQPQSQVPATRQP